jgi:hypothetical protein
VPPIPILILSILILVWISPLLYKRVKESLWARSSKLSELTNDPRKVTAARRNFYWTLSFALAWSLLLSLDWHLRHPGRERGMDKLFAFVLFIATVLRYRQWRVIRANVASYEQSGVVSNAGK